ncbi:MAG: DUF3604 domain-containing protein [Pseudomonadota bacterium]
MKKRYIALGVGGLFLAIGFTAARPYIELAFNVVAAIKPHSHSGPSAELPKRFTEIDRGITDLPTPAGVIDYIPSPNPDRNAYFGDLHVHTALSYDAFAFGTTASPDQAYRFAQGASLMHPSGFQMQLDRPLDFYGVTDHAMYLGVAQEAADQSTEFSKYDVAKYVRGLNGKKNEHWTNQGRRALAFSRFEAGVIQGLRDREIDINLVAHITQNAWKETIEAADAHYAPGRFTTFVAYEYTTSSDDAGNLHRNVIFRSSRRLPVEPFSSFNSRNPEGLWDWMDDLRDQGIESLAIPHNPNGSNGQMFKLEDWAGNPLDDSYAEQRMRNEPLVEVTQVKGTSDTHPLLSKNDEWADFELFEMRIGTILESSAPGGYVRDAYLRGLAQEEKGISNPYKFGLVGSSDTHVGAPSLNEENFHSKSGVLDGTPVDRGSVPITGMRKLLIGNLAPDYTVESNGELYMTGGGFDKWGASGLAGVWAEENTREAIYDAFRRKETFATTGPRIKVRFFAGYDWTEEMLQSEDMVATAYRTGVTMGSDLSSSNNQSPDFLVWTVRDALGAPLQRAQIIKGYVKDGKHFESIYDIACSDGLQPDRITHRCPNNDATVDLDDCSISTDTGADELLTLWQDPEFDSAQDAFYYVRVLENPTCRWSTWDALKNGVKPRPDLHATIQERAWSSPIWYKTSVDR